MKNAIKILFLALLVPVTISFASCDDMGIGIPSPVTPSGSLNPEYMSDGTYECYTYNYVDGISSDVYVNYLGKWYLSNVMFTDLGFCPGNIDEQINFDVNKQKYLSPDHVVTFPIHFSVKIAKDAISYKRVFVASGYQGYW